MIGKNVCSTTVEQFVINQRNAARFGPRFLSMQNAYDKDLRKLVKDTAKENAINIQEGVYAELGGPQFETPAEVRLLKLIGADVVGI